MDVGKRIRPRRIGLTNQNSESGRGGRTKLVQWESQALKKKTTPSLKENKVQVYLSPIS
jgi:hypothetical protein